MVSGAKPGQLYSVSDLDRLLLMQCSLKVTWKMLENEAMQVDERHMLLEDNVPAHKSQVTFEKLITAGLVC